VLTNLAINARDAMPGGGELRMETGTIALSEEDVQQHPAMRPGHYAVLSVTDTGHGMDEATRARVFEPFFTTKPAGVGTGLGLSTVYGVVKQMDGFIWVYSEVGLGTTFRLYFPLSIDQTAPRATPPALVVPNTSAIILVVEDDAAVRQFVVRALDRQPYTVVQADSSERARAILADRPVDLLLTDVRLAGQSGPDFVRSLDQPLRVLYMSGYPDPPGGGDSGLSGQLLQKPFAIPDLLQAVRRALQQPASVPPQMS
jgi:CheY-like chemotaxis protein